MIWDAMTPKWRHWNMVPEHVKSLLWLLLTILIADSLIEQGLGVITARTVHQFSCLKPMHTRTFNARSVAPSLDI